MADAKIKLVLDGTQSVVAGLSAVKDKIGGVQTAVAGLVAVGGALSVGAFASMVKSAADAGESLKDLAAQTGASVEALSAIKGVAKLTDMSIDSVGSAMNKLSKNMATASEDGKGAAQAVKALGLNFEQFKRLSPNEQMMAVAKSMDEFADGGGKAAAAMALYGKEGARMIPFLKDLATVGELHGKVTAEQAEMADNLNDNLLKIRGSGEAWKKAVGFGILPVMSDLSSAWLDAMNGAGGLKQKITELAKDGTLESWVRNAVTGFTYLVDVGQGLISLFPLIGKAIGGAVAATTVGFSAIFDAWVRLHNLDGAGAIEALKSGMQGVKTIAKDVAVDIAGIWNQELLGERIRKGMEEAQKARQTTTSETKKQLQFQEAETTAGAEKARSAYDKLIESIKEKIAIQNAELAATGQLTEGQKLRAKIDTDIANGTLKLSDAQKGYVHTLLDTLVAEEKGVETKKAMAKAAEDLIAVGDKSVKTIEEQLQRQREHNAEIGLSKEQIADLAASKLDLEAAADRELAANLRVAANVAGPLHDAYLQYAADLDHVAEAKSQLAQEKRTGAALEVQVDEHKKLWESIDRTAHDTFVHIFENGKSALDRLKDTLKSGLLDMLYQMTVKKWVISIAASMTGMAMPGTAQAVGGGGSDIGSAMMNAWQLANGGIGAGIGSAIGRGVSGIGGFFGSASTSAFGSGMGMSSGQAAEAAKAYEAAGMSDIAGSLKMGQTFGMASGYVTGIGTGLTVGKAISGDYGMGGSPNRAVNVGTAIGAVIGGPIGAAIGGAIGGLANRAFGRKPKETESFGIQGTFNASGFEDAKTYARWKQKGGWFRSDKSGTDYSAIDKDTYQAISNSYTALKMATVEYASALGLSTASIKGYSKGIVLDLTDDQQKNQEIIAKLFADMGDEIAVGLRLPEQTIDFAHGVGGIIASAFNAAQSPLESFKREGETFGQVLTRLGVVFKATDQLATAFGRSVEQVFGGKGLSTASIRQSLIDTVGGVDTFNSQLTAFVTTYLSEAEQMAPTIKALDSQMASLNLSSIKTKDQFKQLVMGLDLAKESDQQLYAALMQLAPTFATVADYTDKVAQKNKELANQKLTLEATALEVSGNKAAAMAIRRQMELDAMDESLRPLQQRVWVLQDEADAAVEVQTKVADAKNALSDAYNRESGALEDTIDKFRDFGQSLREFRQSLLTGDLSTLSPEARYSELRAEFERTYSLAKSGDPEAMSRLQDVSQRFLEASQSYYASSEGYTHDFDMVRSALANAATAADMQVTIAQSQLSALNQLVEGRIELNASVLSVRDAITGLKAAQAASAAAATPSGGGGGGAASGASSSNSYVINNGRLTGTVNGYRNFNGMQVDKGLYWDSLYGYFRPDGSHANGLDRVPFDNYRAILHRGERVQTANEARQADRDRGSVAALLEKIVVELQADKAQRGAVGTATLEKLDGLAEGLASNKRAIVRGNA